MERKNSSQSYKSDNEEGKKPKVDLDTILVEEIGQLGFYQMRTVVLAAVVVIFSGWHAEYVFTAARINTRCLIPECENTADNQEFAPSWISHAIPSSGSSFDNCQRFANVSRIEQTVNNTCPSTLFDVQTIIPCDQFVYENTDTVVYDYNLACNEWQRSLIGTMRTTGQLAALPLTGFISDRWGRRTAITINAFNTAWIGLTRLFAGTYSGFVVSQAVESAFGGGVFSSAYILLMELVGPNYRVFIGAFISSFFALGQALLGLIAWGVPDWRKLTIAVYTPQLLTISCFWLMAESIRWYLSKGRYEESERALKAAARVNGKKLSEKSLLALRQTVEEEKKREALEKEQRIHEPWLIEQVFHHKSILLRCIVTPVWWITTTFIYYGMTINSVNITGNSYVNFVTVALVEIPGFWISFILMSRIGRKPVLAGAFSICAACQIGYMFIPDDMYVVGLIVYLIGKCSIATVVTAIYVYTAELYPTKHRHSLLAFSSMVGRIGSILAPLTPAFGDNLPFILFASLSLLSGVLVFLTPETLGSKFPDTMEEAENIGNKLRE